MSRIRNALRLAHGEGRAALVAYLCAGDPDLEITPDLVVAVAEAGADIVELGVPFSDPSADGPVIQRASERALAGGTTLDGVLDAVRAIRTRSEVPILLFGYYNPLHRRGDAEIVEQAKAAGADGFLVVDLPPDEAGVLRDPAVAAGLDWVPLVAPTSTAPRIELAARAATSFIYCISIAGVTGAGHADVGNAARRAAEVREKTGTPVALGFGIKTPEDVAAAAPHVDAVVVGSALVSAIENAPRAPIEAARDLVRALAARLVR